MTLDQLRARHRDDILRITSEYGMENVRVFGSYARGEATEQSDLDLLVTLTKPIGWGYAGSERLLREKLNMPVQVIADRALHPFIRDNVLAEAIRL